MTKIKFTWANGVVTAEEVAPFVNKKGDLNFPYTWHIPKGKVKIPTFKASTENLDLEFDTYDFERVRTKDGSIEYQEIRSKKR
jgi:hypothetical protein